MPNKHRAQFKQTRPSRAINLAFAIQRLPQRFANRVRRFIRAYQRGDLDHADDLIDAALILEQTPEGRAFVEAFGRVAVDM